MYKVYTLYSSYRKEEIAMPTIAVHPPFNMHMEEQGQGPPSYCSLHGFCGNARYGVDLASLLAGTVASLHRI
jgi:hypothetical protein